MTLARTCLTKTKYPSKRAAKEAIQSILRNRNDNDPRRRMKPYRCDLCEQWHIGHSQNR